MPVKKRSRKVRGGSGFTDFFTKTIPSAARTVYNGVKPVYNFIKDNKLVSRGFALIPHPNAQKAAVVAGQAGFGRRRVVKKRRVVRRMTGGGSSAMRM